MSILSTIRGWFGGRPNIIPSQLGITLHQASALDKVRSTPLYQYNLNGYIAKSASGAEVTARSAMSLSGVLACVRNLAEDFAGLPICVYKKVAGKKTEQVDHPVYKLLHDGPPNPEMTAFTFRSAMMISVLLYGKACAEIERDGLGRPIALWPLEPWDVVINRDFKGNIVFSYRGVDLPARDVLYIPGPVTTDGILGAAYPKLGKDVLGLAIAMQGFCSAWFANGAQAGVTLKIPPTMSADAALNMKNQWIADHQGYDNTNKITVVEKDVDVESDGGDETETKGLVDQRVFQVQDLCRIWRVPPNLIYEWSRATWSNSEQASLDYVKFSLRPWAIRWEETLKWKMIPETGIYVKHNMDALLRGDLKSRADAYSVLVDCGVYLRSECRDLEDLDFVEGTDVALVSTNTQAATALETKPDSEIAKGTATETPAPANPAVPAKPETPNTAVTSDYVQAALEGLFIDAVQRFNHYTDDRMKRQKDVDPQQLADRVKPVVEAAEKAKIKSKDVDWIKENWQAASDPAEFAKAVFNG